MTIPREAWDLSRLPAHLRFTFRVTDDGRVLAAGKDLTELRRQLRPRLQAALAEAARDLTRTGLRTWDFGALPREFTRGQVRAYPALADAGDAVDIRLFETEAAGQRGAMRLGTRRLLLLAGSVRRARRRQPAAGQRQAGHEPAARTRTPPHCSMTARPARPTRSSTTAGGPAWDAEGFARLLEAARSQLAVRRGRRGRRRRPGAGRGARGRDRA